MQRHLSATAPDPDTCMRRIDGALERQHAGAHAVDDLLEGGGERGLIVGRIVGRVALAAVERLARPSVGHVLLVLRAHVPADRDDVQRDALRVGVLRGGDSEVTSFNLVGPNFSTQKLAIAEPTMIPRFILSKEISPVFAR